jgi:hypothetical protein
MVLMLKYLGTKKVKPHHQIFFSQAATKQGTLYVSMLLKNIKLLIE